MKKLIKKSKCMIILAVVSGYLSINCAASPGYVAACQASCNEKLSECFTTYFMLTGLTTSSSLSSYSSSSSSSSSYSSSSSSSPSSAYSAASSMAGLASFLFLACIADSSTCTSKCK